MFLSEFLFDVEERYASPFDDDSVDLARIAACNIVELIKRRYDVSEFFELIFTESCDFEYRSGFQYGSQKNEVPF